MATSTDPIVYLSDEWIAAADDAVAGLEPVEADAVVGFVVESDDETVAYEMVLGPTRVSVRSGVATAGVTLTLDRALAAAIARGETSAQRAFLDGRLVVGGDIRVLLGQAKAVASVDDRLGPLRARTRF